MKRGSNQVSERYLNENVSPAKIRASDKDLPVLRDFHTINLNM